MEEEHVGNDLVGMSNDILINLGREGYLKDASECDHNFFVDVYKGLLGDSLPGLISSAETTEDEIHNIQVVIDSLGSDVLGTDISHVNAQMVVNKDKTHIRCLLEIFYGLLEYVIEQLDGEEEAQDNGADGEDEKGDEVNNSVDSNKMDDDHEILSDVIQEEFGKSYQDNISDIMEYDKPKRLLPPKSHPQVVAYQKETFQPPLSSVFTDGVTWQSGDDNHHTVVWSKAPRSPSGDSTATEELINLAHYTGNSTDELIREAQCVQRNLLEEHKIKSPPHAIVVPTSNIQEEDIVCDNLPSPSTFLLSFSSHGDGDLGGGVEALQHIERENKRKKKKKKEVQVQTQTQTEYHNQKNKDGAANISAPDISSIICCSDYSSSGVSTLPEMTKDSLQITIDNNSILTTTTNSTLTNTTHNASSSAIELDSPACTRQTNPIDVVHVHVGKNKKSGREVTVGSKYKRKPPPPPSEVTAAVAAVASKDQKDELPTESRSKQLSHLSERLQKLRNQVQPCISTSLEPKEKPTLPLQTNTTCKKKEKLKTPTHQKHPAKKTEKKDKDKAKVSFAVDSLVDDDYHCSVSDTEIDYVSSPHYRVLQDGRRRAHHLVQALHHGKGGWQTSPTKGILRAKVANAVDVADESVHKFEASYILRDERLCELREGLREEEKENKINVGKLRDRYSKVHERMISEKRNVKKQSNVQKKEIKNKQKVMERFHPDVTASSSLKKEPINKFASKLSAMYGRPQASPTKMYGKPQTTPTKSKGRKRSASASPVRRTKYRAPLVLKDNEILPVMEEEFPFIHLSPHAAKLMWQKQLRQVGVIRKHAVPHKTTSKVQKTIQQAQSKQKQLAQIMKKELEHTRRLKDLKERKDKDTFVRRNLEERRQRSARARRYYDEYAIRNKARMLKKRTKEEKIFKQLFEDGLDIQKQRIKEMRDYAREQKQKNAIKQQNEVESLENFYRDKFSVLAESIAQEKYDLEMRDAAQSQVLQKMRCQMRKRMEKDLKDIQEELNNDDDAYFFRQLDADVLKKQFQLATYKASK